MNITFNTYPTTTMPSVCAGPFTVSFSARPIACCAEYELSLCAYDSNSYSHYSVQDEDRLYLIPRWRFLDTDFNIVSSLPISTVSSVDSITGTASFWYIDDMPFSAVKINVEVRNIINYPVSSCNVSAIMGTTSASAMISLSVGEWTPQLIKYTSDGVSDVSAKWTENPIKWYATLHQELSSPIIFSESFNLTSTLVSVTSEFCPLTAAVLAFDKNDNYGWTSGSCITNLSSINASISGNAFVLSDSSYVNGTSNEFKIRPFQQPFEIRRQNESWDATKSIKSYAMAPHLNSKYNLWDNFVGHSVGQVNAGQQIGRKSYERIANFPANHIDIDESNIKQLYSISQYLDVPIDDYDLNYPPELQRLIDIGSISHSKLWGEIVKCNLNITDNQICPRCGHKHSNLGDMIEDPFNYTVTAGVPFIQHDRFNISPDGWTIEYPPPYEYYGRTWSSNLSSVSASWLLPGLSYDGQYQTIGQYGGYVYNSNDYGTTWTLNSSLSSTPRKWLAQAICGTGQYQLASENASNVIYRSDDYGVTYNPTTAVGSWTVAMNYSGRYQIAAFPRIMVSHNYGVDWFEVPDVDVEGGDVNLAWYGASISNDGKYMIIAAEREYIFISSDYGRTWSRDNVPIGRWWWVSMSGDAQHRMAITNNNTPITSSSGKIYISNDFGATWHVATAPGTGYNWWACGMDKTGRFMMTGHDNVLWTSWDYGATWAREDLYIINEANMGISGDGIYQIVGDGQIFSPVPTNFYSLKRNIRQVSIPTLTGTICNSGSARDTIPLSTYPFNWLTAYDIDLCGYFDYYEYIDGYPLIETCDPLDPRYIQAAGVINRNDEYNTLDVYSVSSVEDWFGDDGKLQEAIEYELLRGLQLNSQTCNISS